MIPDADSQSQRIRRDAAGGRLAEHIKRVVDEAPPLTDEQRARIAAVMRSGANW